MHCSSDNFARQIPRCIFVATSGHLHRYSYKPHNAVRGLKSTSFTRPSSLQLNRSAEGHLRVAIQQDFFLHRGVSGGGSSRAAALPTVHRAYRSWLRRSTLQKKGEAIEMVHRRWSRIAHFERGDRGAGDAVGWALTAAVEANASLDNTGIRVRY